MHSLHVVIIALLYAASSWAVPEQLLPNSIPFNQARDIILSKNKGLKSVQLESDAAQAGIAQAGAFQNPTIALELDRFGTNEIEATVEQTFELGGKRSLRTDVAQKEFDVAQNNGKIALLELDAEIVRRFIPIVDVSRKLSLLDSIILIAQATRQQIDKRVEAGASKKTDLIRAEIDIEQLLLERSELVAQDEQARKKFAALGGVQDSVLLNVSGSVLDEVAVPLLGDLRNAIGVNPQLIAADLEREQLATQEKLLGAEVKPDLTILAGYLRDNSSKSNSPIVGFSMNIPLFNKNAAAQNQVQLQQQAITGRKENALNLLLAEIIALQSRLNMADKRISTLKTSTIPKVEQVYSMMQEYYTAGSTGFLDLTTSQAEMLRLRMDLLEIQTERAQMLVDLMQITSLHIEIVK
jgi:cobalt-zinc-cadmium efflux system outer membrane protein